MFYHSTCTCCLPVTQAGWMGPVHRLRGKSACCTSLADVKRTEHHTCFGNIMLQRGELTKGACLYPNSNKSAVPAILVRNFRKTASLTQLKFRFTETMFLLGSVHLDGHLPLVPIPKTKRTTLAHSRSSGPICYQKNISTIQFKGVWHWKTAAYKILALLPRT